MTYWKRMAASSAAVALIASGLFGLGQSPAAAAGGCNISIPSRLAITSPFRQWKPTVACSGYGYYAAWDSYGPLGWDTIFIWDYETIDWENLYDWQDLGQFQAQAQSCWDSSYDDCWYQNTVNYTIKYGSQRQTKAYRNGTKVDIPMKITRYSYSARAMRAWSGGLVKVYANGTYLKTLRLSDAGTARLTTYTSTVKDYRFKLGDTWNTFGQDFTIRR
jgi:hypothetical protein